MIYRGMFKVSSTFDLTFCLSRLQGLRVKKLEPKHSRVVSESQRGTDLSSGFMRQFVGQPTGEKRSVQKRIIHTYTQSESRKQKRDLFGEEVNKYPRAHCAGRLSAGVERRQRWIPDPAPWAFS